jgi:hypothetical protein
MDKKLYFNNWRVFGIEVLKGLEYVLKFYYLQSISPVFYVFTLQRFSHKIISAFLF